MASNLDLIRSALQSLGVLAEGEEPSAEQASHALGIMNDLLEDWSGHGIEVGQYPQTDLSEDYPGPSTTVPAVKANLAVWLAPHYERAVPSAVVVIASRGYDRLLREALVSQLSPVALTNTPLGEGDSDLDNILTGE